LAQNCDFKKAEDDSLAFFVWKKLWRYWFNGCFMF